MKYYLIYLLDDVVVGINCYDNEEAQLKQFEQDNALQNKYSNGGFTKVQIFNEVI